MELVYKKNTVIEPKLLIKAHKTGTRGRGYKSLKLLSNGEVVTVLSVSMEEIERALELK
jgi:hypothetical protein